MSCVGIIANPASGKDIRRLVAHASVFDNNEKSTFCSGALAWTLAGGAGAIMPDYMAWAKGRWMG
jgi:predicted polyphosphate/ATP-dependent NAD kinase